MPLPRGCITVAEGCVLLLVLLLLNAVGVGPPLEKTNCNNRAKLHRVCFYVSCFRPSDRASEEKDAQDFHSTV